MIVSAVPALRTGGHEDYNTELKESKMTVPKSLYLLHELILLTVVLLIRDLIVDMSKKLAC